MWLLDWFPRWGVIELVRPALFQRLESHQVRSKIDTTHVDLAACRKGAIDDKSIGETLWISVDSIESGVQERADSDACRRGMSSSSLNALVPASLAGLCGSPNRSFL